MGSVVGVFCFTREYSPEIFFSTSIKEVEDEILNELEIIRIKNGLNKYEFEDSLAKFNNKNEELMKIKSNLTELKEKNKIIIFGVGLNSLWSEYYGTKETLRKIDSFLEEAERFLSIKKIQTLIFPVKLLL